MAIKKDGKPAGGYIAIYRTVKDHWIYEKGRKRTKYEAWLDLLLMASHNGWKDLVGLDVIEIQRGQIFTSQDKLSKEWFWDRSTVRAFLQILQKDGMINIKSTSKFTVITICKYDTYQTISPTKQHQNPQQDNSAPPQSIRYNKDKEDIGDKSPEQKMKDRKVDFGKTLEPFKETYSSEMLKNFYNYWGESNVAKTKLRFELEKTWELELRLKTWHRNDGKFSNQTKQQPTAQQLNKADEILAKRQNRA